MKALSTSILVATLALTCLVTPVVTLNAYDIGPTLFWFYGTGGAILDVKNLPDVNGDGRSDAVVGSADNNVYVLDGTDGSKIWNKLTGGDVVSVGYIDDVSGDGIAEVICGSSDGKVYLLNGTDGKVIWEEPIYRNPPIFRVLAIEDVTGDGKPDVIANGKDGYDAVVECKAGNNGTRKWYKDDSRYYQGDTPDFAVLNDVTGDGKQDVVWNYHDYSERTALLNGETGATVKSTTLIENTAFGTLVFAVPDVSGDDYEDILTIRTKGGLGAYAYLLSGPSLEEIWIFTKPTDASQRMWDGNYISDVTSDGRPEIVIGWKDKLFCLNGINRSEIWNTTVANGNTQYTRSHRITEGRDLSGDNVDDIVVGVENGKVYFLSGSNGASILDPYQIGGSVNSVAYLDDVTGDSIPEILVGGGDHFIYCLTITGEKLSTKIVFSLTPNPTTVQTSVTLLGNLTTEYNSPIPGAIVNVRVNGSARGTLTTNATGWFKASGQVKSAGTFNVTVEYPGSVLYHPSSDWELLVVNKADTVIYAVFVPNPADSGETCILEGVLLVQPGNPIRFAVVSVEYSIDYGETWHFVGNLTTNSYGIFSKTFKGPSQGIYLVRISYAGSSSHNPSTAVEPLIVR